MGEGCIGGWIGLLGRIGRSKHRLVEGAQGSLLSMIPDEQVRGT